jgi:hypothetical protein
MEVSMSTGAIIGIIVAVVIVVAIVAVASMQLRRTRMRRQFGPEYDRLAKEIGPRKADAELTARQRRVEALGIRPLPADQQARYSGDWAVVQERFVDAPVEAVGAADTLIWNVMSDSGYPTSDRNASIEALSVYHAHSLEGYRRARDLRIDSATTEELREAIIRYRALFEDLTGLREDQGQPSRDRVAEINGQAAENDRAAADDSSRTAANGDLAAPDHDPAETGADRTVDTPR